MRYILAGILSLAASCGTLRPAFAAPSATALFESVVFTYCAEAKECHQPRNLLSERGQRKLASSIVRACDRVWPGQAGRYEWLFALKLTETACGPSSTMTSERENTHGPFCLSLFEAREAAMVLQVKLPHSARETIQTLRDDYPLSALLAAWTLASYEHTMCDRIEGLLSFKYGPRGLARAKERLDKRPVTDLIPWQRFAQKLAEVECVRTRVEHGAPAVCGCLP